MTYETIRTAAEGDPPWTAAEYNVFRANFEAGVPALMATKGQLALATAANAANVLTVGANGSYLVAASGETTGAKYAHNSAGRLSGSTHSGNAAGYYIPFDTEDFDVYGIHSTSSNTQYFGVAVAGYYFLSVAYSVTFTVAPAVNDYFRFSLRTGTSTLCYLSQVYTQSTNTVVSGSGSTIYYLAASPTLYGFYREFSNTNGGDLTMGGAQVRASVIRLGSIGVAT